MRFGRQLIIGHIALLFVTIVTGTTAVIALRVTNSKLESVTREISAEVIDVQRLRFQAEQVVATSRGFLLTGEAETWKRFEAAVERVRASLDSLHVRQTMHRDVTRIDEAARTYVAAAETAARRRTATGDPRQIVPMFETSLSLARERFEDSIATMLSREKADFDLASRHARSLAHRTQQLVLMTTALGIGLSIALALVSIRKLRGHYERERAATASAQRSSDARDELLAIVSHDLTSPLTAIALGAGLLEDEVTDSQARKHVAVVRNATDRMQRLIEQLLDKATIEAGTIDLHTEPCDVGQLLRTVEELFTSRARMAGVLLIVDVESGLVATADREKVIQILSNLVGNALKFTPRGGRITLAASAVRDGICFEVSDTGGGIPAEQVPHLFERYWQGGARGRGSLGLGLYIAKHLVEAHGGCIDVRTAIGRGTTFWFELPAKGSTTLAALGVPKLADR